jgi:hypothetical protein
MSLCTRHTQETALFALGKCIIDLFQGVISTLFDPVSNPCPGPTPAKGQRLFGGPCASSLPTRLGRVTINRQPRPG